MVTSYPEVVQNRPENVIEELCSERGDISYEMEATISVEGFLFRLVN